MKKGENNDRFLLLGLMCILYLEINVIKTVHPVSYTHLTLPTNSLV